MTSIAKQPENIKENFDKLLAGIEGVKPDGKGGHLARCPAHDDKNPSLSIKQTPEKILLHCHAGCETSEILKALGLDWKDLRIKENPGSFEIVETYDYQDAEGKLVFQAVRALKDGRKSFYQRRPSTSGAWINNLQGLEPILYNLPAVIEAPEIIITEGEKDVEALKRAGFIASCNPMGAGKWRPEYNAALQGKFIVIIPDDDGPGRGHAETIARSLDGAAKVKIAKLPNPDGKQGFDVSDYLEAGGTAEALRQLIDDAPEYKPGPAGKSCQNGNLKTEAKIAKQAAAEPEAPEKTTELGNARRLARLHGRDLRYVDPWGKFLIWDGARWALDQEKAIDRLAENVARDIDRQSAETADSNERKELRKWASASERKATKEGMFDWIKNRIAALPDHFDADKFLITARNKTLELDQGKAREPAREDLITKRADVEYKTGADCPEFKKFLDMIMNGEAELIDFLQKAVGYSMTGAIDERCIFILYGPGRNGKTTFIQTISGLLNDYAQRIPTETLLARRTEGIPNDIAALKGIRFAYAEEAKQGRSFSEGKLKDLTGGTTLPARFMRAEWFNFRPEFKLWLCTNHKPVIKGTDDAVWDRIRLIPFRVKIPDAKMKPLREVEEMFNAERPGIFNWALEGAARWLKEGLKQPAAVRAAGAEYRNEMDIIAGFIEDRVEFDKLKEATVKELYEAYCAWCESNGEKPIGKRDFGERIRERGIDQYQRPAGKKERAWLGIGLLQ